METSGLVSVITPVYNSENYLAETIQSVLSQSYENWELILVDDSSNDNSIQIINSFCKKDNRINLIHLDSNQGPAVARNTAIESASGRYIAFLDSDDIWHPDKLFEQITFMKEGEYLFSYTYYEKIDVNSRPLGKIVKPDNKISYDDLLKSNQIGCLTAIYDTKKLGKIYMPGIKKRQDYGLWLKILKNIDFAYCLPEVLAYYRVGNSSISKNKLSLIKSNWELFRDIENFSFIKSVYYLTWNVYRKLKYSL